MRTRPLLIVVVTFIAVAPTARAELVAFWRHNPITPQAIAADPQLAGMQSWSLLVTNTDGPWDWAGMRATLPTGLPFYNTPPDRRGGWTHPNPGDITMYPDVEFDTYVSGPRNQSGAEDPAVFGPFPENQPPLSFGGPSDPLPGTFSVTWGDPTGQPHAPGTYEFARLTFPRNAVPEIHVQSFVAFVVPDRTILIPRTIPEPTAAAVVLLLLCMLHIPRLRPRAHPSLRRVT
jgi:hypothetical protein